MYIKVSNIMYIKKLSWHNLEAILEGNLTDHIFELNQEINKDVT